MLAPISWIKDYVEVKLNLKDLMWRMTEIGLTTENYQKEGNETVLDVEVTPNRPDWLSIVGIAREIAVLQNKKIAMPKINKIPKAKGHLPMNIKNDFKLCPRYTAICIKNVEVKESPEWLKKRLKLVGLRPINNLVDITNYVMFELGNPIHVFDYDKFNPKEMTLSLSKGGEKFVSVDDKPYVLPKNAIIFKNGDSVVDLCGIKGGANSGVSGSTKNIFIHVAVYDGKFIRRTSQALGLSSDASKIFERGADASGTETTLKRVVNLVLENAGGNVASNVIDQKIKDFKSVKLALHIDYLEKVLGIKIQDKKMVQILSNLNLSPKLYKKKIICTIPTYRGDLKIEEDLVEEVARIYGYNNFPKSLPEGKTQSNKVPYYFDDNFHFKLKSLLVSAGMDEVMTYSLMSKDDLEKSKLKIEEHIKIANPVSIDYEYLRTSLVPNLIKATKLNVKENRLNLFELGKVYLGKLGNVEEKYFLSGIIKGEKLSKVSSIIDLLVERLNIPFLRISENESGGYWGILSSAEVIINGQKVGNYGEIDRSVLENWEINEKVYAFELDVKKLENVSREKVFQSVPKYPPQIEDLTIIFPPKINIYEVIEKVRKADKLIYGFVLSDVYEKDNSYTFRIWYQDPNKTLTDSEVEKIREKIIREVKQKFGGIVKG